MSIKRRTFLGSGLKLFFFLTIILTPLKKIKILKYRKEFNESFKKFLSKKYILSIKKGYNIVPFGHYYIILNKEYKPVIAINDTAFFIWRNLEKVTIESIINKVTKNYDVIYSEAKQDVLNTIFIFYKLSMIKINI